MTTVGEDCHITLMHEDVNGGAAYGFVLDPDSRARPEGVQMTREVVGDETEEFTTVWIHFDVLLADELINPDGSLHTESRSEMYSKLLEYLDKREGVNLDMCMGTIMNLGA
ncbi:MAG: hypothetical protein JEZ06_02755, partial [Anaerolineaceae bacterium]|nr:hypothetical protein [Anaerolineaceae bacterium]